MPPSSRILVAASSAASVLAFGAPAQAATLTAPPCVLTVSSVGTVPLAGTGFTPGARVTVVQSTSKGSPPTFFTSGTADPAGNFAATPSAPSFNPFSRQLQTFTLGAVDGVNPANVAVTSFKQVRAGYDFKPSGGNPRRIVTHTARGFPIGKSTYLHLRFGGRTIRTVKLGRSTSPCGIVTKRLPLLPARARRGLWSYFVDQRKSFSKSTRPQSRSGLRVTVTFRRR